MSLGVILLFCSYCFTLPAGRLALLHERTEECEREHQYEVLNCLVLFLCSAQDNSLTLLVLWQCEKNFQISIAPLEGSGARGRAGSQHSFPVRDAFCQRPSPGRKRDVRQERRQKAQPTCFIRLWGDEKCLVRRGKNIYCRDTFLETLWPWAAPSAIST